MNKIIKHARIVLEKANQPMTEEELKGAVLEVYPNAYFPAVKKYCNADTTFDIGVWKDLEGGETMYMLYPMTDEELAAKKADLEWFDSL